MGRRDPQRGERARFERLFRENSPAVLGYALRRTARPEDAADVVSETMLTAWRRFDSVPAGEGTRFWLLGVARNVLANHDRSTVRRSRLGERLRIELGAISTTDFTDDLEMRSVVRQALSRLAEDDREIVLLTSWEGLTPSEAARVVGIEPAAARTRLHRARLRLREDLEGQFEPEPAEVRPESRREETS